jgi:hypothetical protein
LCDFRETTTKKEPQKMNESVEELEAKIFKLQTEIAAKKKKAEDANKSLQKEEFERETPARRLAILMHQCTCHQNHTDGCAWHSDISWSDHTHARELERAARILNVLPVGYKSELKVVEFVNAFAGYDVPKRMAQNAARREVGCQLSNRR